MWFNLRPKVRPENADFHGTNKRWKHYEHLSFTFSGPSCPVMGWTLNFTFTFILCFFSVGDAAQFRGLCPPHLRGFSWSHKTGTTQLVGLPWTSDQLVSDNPENSQNSRQKSMRPVEFEPTIVAGDRPQTYALDRAAAGTGYILYYL
jgi:hypothetical protein